MVTEQKLELPKSLFLEFLDSSSGHDWDFLLDPVSHSSCPWRQNIDSSPPKTGCRDQGGGNEGEKNWKVGRRENWSGRKKSKHENVLRWKLIPTISNKLSLYQDIVHIYLIINLIQFFLWFGTSCFSCSEKYEWKKWMKSMNEMKWKYTFRMIVTFKRQAWIGNGKHSLLSWILTLKFFGE